MTCIVGVAIPGEGAVVGADSLGASSEAHGTVATPKLHQPRSWLAFGFTTSWRFGQLLAYELELDRDRAELVAVERDVERWLVTTFVPAARKTLTAGGFTTKQNEHEEAGSAVIAVRDRVFRLNEDFAILEYADGVATCGYGYNAARVAAVAARDIDPTFPAPDLAAFALRHAELAVPYVRGPFAFKTTSLR